MNVHHSGGVRIMRFELICLSTQDFKSYATAITPYPHNSFRLIEMIYQIRESNSYNHDFESCASASCANLVCGEAKFPNPHQIFVVVSNNFHTSQSAPCPSRFGDATDNLRLTRVLCFSPLLDMFVTAGNGINVVLYSLGSRRNVTRTLLRLLISATTSTNPVCLNGLEPLTSHTRMRRVAYIPQAEIEETGRI